MLIKLHVMGTPGISNSFPPQVVLEQWLWETISSYMQSFN